MNKTWALVPVKSPEQSKTRLSSVLQPQECAMLSRAMFMDVLAALDAANGISHIAVLTSDPEVTALANQLGHEVITDTATGDLCASLNEASGYVTAQGAETMLIVPGDIPTVMSTDIEQLLQSHEGGLSLCPAIRDGGTNAIICSPPNAMPYQFGEDSARRHMEVAEQNGITTSRLPMQAFFRDIDTPDDLLWLSHQTSDGNTIRFLHQSGIFARLGSGHAGATA
ncbi:MAG: 2-phospho-L-lactate guanylyltransferase [Gammaproteobacteria bacterium]|nr:2-phospho-L-lactate guanylyltransferase [Gammaproteobacteria bacterium]MCP4928066.1 2-phospho-L-lactate guanylyltransferase [Gammaproteobacteria bacterium]